jgi:gamma-glutamyltranspeptidase / glutathione hydrolase
LRNNDKHFTRRQFLRHGSAALAAVPALRALGLRATAADAPSAKSLTNTARLADGPRQGIACLRREAAEAAREVFKDGGNAIDAAMAALLALFVVEPSMTGLGGYGGSMVIYHAKSGKVDAIDFTGRAPRKFDPATFNAKSANHGNLAIVVPGNVAGIDLALRKYGTQSFRKVAKHAINLAESGFVVIPRLAGQMAGLVKSIDPVSRHAYLPNGVPALGSVWKQPDLARLMRRLGDEGPGSFYTGEVAATICKQVQANGGVLAEEDFRDFRATKCEPLFINYRGHDLYTPPLPSAGLTSLSVLKTFEQFDLPSYTPWGAPYFELFLGAINLAWGEREKYFGDPEFVNVPVEDLLSEEHAKTRAAELRKGTPVATAGSTAGEHTVNLVVVDKEGNLVSCTATHGNDFGSHVAIEGLGLMLGHGMSRFDFKRDSPNYAAAGKRPQHNMSPLVVLSGGKPYAGLGMPGGQRIVTVTTQLAVNLIDFKATPLKVVTAPRIHVEGKEPVKLTSDAPAGVAEALKKHGHQVQQSDSIGGDANAVVVDLKTGAVEAAASKNSNGVLVF